MSLPLIRIGVAGCGRIARTHLEALQQLPQFQLVALCDTDAAAATTTAADFDRPQVFADSRRMAEEARLDAIIICTPPVTHHDLAISLLERGLHVLCEKPLATSLSDARHMTQVAGRSGRVLLMATKFRYVEDVIQARDILRAGRLGEVALLAIRFCSLVPMAGRWNADPAVAGGGVIMDNGPHALDLARFLVAPIERIQTLQARTLQSLPVEDTALLSLAMSGGAVGTVTLSWSVPCPDDYYVQVSGTRGTLAVGWRGSQLYTLDTGAVEPFGRGYDKRDAFRRQLEHFAACIQGGTPALTDVEDTLACMAMIEAAYGAIHRGGQG